jgi:hypothetical protein
MAKRITYSVKYWATKKNYLDGNAQFTRANYYKDFTILMAIFTDLSRGKKGFYAFEIFEDKSGETVYHSEE